jgi:hypothetical protein
MQPGFGSKGASVSDQHQSTLLGDRLPELRNIDYLTAVANGK